MSINRQSNSFWITWDRLAFIIYSLSTVFMIFFSVVAVKKWPSPWNQLSILIACLAPFLMVLLKNIPEWARSKNIPSDIKVIIILFALGAVNVFFSSDQLSSLKGMGLFLISGVVIFVTSSYLLNSKTRILIFSWLVSSCLFIIILHGLYAVSKNQWGYSLELWPDFLFSYNPLPAGSSLILLSAGPLVLFSKAKPWCKYFIFPLVFLSTLYMAYHLAGKGLFVSLFVMIVFSGYIFAKRFWLFSLILVLILMMGYQFKDSFPQYSNVYKNKLVLKDSALIRLEYYFFAYHILKKEPLFGVGYHTPLETYLSDYEKKVIASAIENRPFSYYVKQLTTLDNMLLCLWVEGGSLFIAIYLFFLYSLFRRFFLEKSKAPEDFHFAMLLLVPLIGFMIHSMTYDSLKFPNLNWLFHSLLGLMVNITSFFRGPAVNCLPVNHQNKNSK